MIIGICGIGQMGSSAAVAFQRAGHRVLLWARNPEKLAKIKTELDRLVQWSCEHVGPVKRAGGELILEPNLERLDEEADVVLDSILEIMEDKVALFRRFDAAKKRGALFLSATSGLSITEMGRRGEVESLLVGAHFWNPPHLIPVVEMVQGEKTPVDKMDAACALMEDIGKIPIRCKDILGFVGNRLMHAMWREALALVDQGACTPEDIDRIVKLTFALRLPALGPMENMDLVGIDAVQRVQTYLLPDLANNTAPARSLAERVAAGECGMKSGKGFYDWTKRDAAKLIANRDHQIARQLQFLKEIGEL